MRIAIVFAGLVVLGGSLGVAALHAGSAPSFVAPTSYATGRDPESVAIGDLNSDGKPDLVTANADDGAVSVLLNRGDGGFGARRNYATGHAPSSVAIGDLNGDGRPDLAFANGLNTVSVLLNRGDRSFGVRRDYAGGLNPFSLALSDLNGDGRPDLAIANGDPANTVSVLLNSGDGSFGARRAYVAGRNPSSVALGDLNGDGKPDLATANYAASTVSVLLNRGDGSFQAKRDYRTGGGPASVAIGDLNGDGRPDLATANNDSGTVSVLLNRGDGRLQAERDYRTGREPYSVDSVSIGDLNGDGAPDLAIGNSLAHSHTVSVLTNTGGGSFQPTLDYAAGLNPYSVALGDLNGDSRPDLAIANGIPANTVSVLLNTPGLCTVQAVKRQTLPAAKRTIARANCRVGKIRRAYSKTVKRGRVISQKPRFGAVLPGGGKVKLVVSRGWRRS